MVSLLPILANIGKGILENLMETSYIQAKPNQRYLSEVLKDYGNSLPKNCLFDKVTTGCGGTYVALTSPEPYVIAVPTKALVEDKIKSQGYANVKLIAVSGDHKYIDHSGTEHNGIPNGYDKIICTYHQLGNILRHINPSEWNLLIDEMHLLSRLVTFSPSVLRDILQYYPLFKSYCFMSATIPKTEHLLPGIKDIDRVTMVWPHVTPITFQGYKATSVKDSVLQIAIEHLDNIRPGNAYFFYNSVAGICSALKQLKKLPGAKENIRVVSAKTPGTKKRITKEGFKISSSADPHGKINFVTSAAFEGADFLDEDGVTYIVTEDKYEHTKYSVTTAIPQIVGRLRNSKYNSLINVIFDTCYLLDARTPEEFMQYIEHKEKNANGTVETFGFAKSRGDTREVLPGIVNVALQTIYNTTEGLDLSIEELVGNIDLISEEADFSKVEVLFNSCARYVDLEFYDIMHTNHAILNPEGVLLQPLTGSAKNLSSMTATAKIAPELSARNRSRLNAGKKPSTKDMVEIFKTDPEFILEVDPDLHAWLSVLGVEKAEALQARRGSIKSAYDKKIASSQYMSKQMLKHWFKVGNVYRPDEIKVKVQNRTGIAPKSTQEALKLVRKYYEVKATVRKGFKVYSIVRTI